jgi:nucleotide-binding universal stress UspA family protein
MEVPMYRRILVPLDGSEHAESVLPLACTLANISDAEITLLRVVEYPYKLYSRFNSHPNTDPWATERLWSEREAIRSRIEGYIERVASSLEWIRSKVFAEVQEGPVVDTILSFAEKSDIDVIVMSTAGQDRSPWMIGAVTNRILREGQIPVILMKVEPGGSIPDSSSIQRKPMQKYIESQNEYSR